jgi:hypothetical protein
MPYPSLDDVPKLVAALRADTIDLSGDLLARAADLIDRQSRELHLWRAPAFAAIQEQRRAGR